MNFDPSKNDETTTTTTFLYLFFRRALKATFVLIPLFGIQLFVTIYRLPAGTKGAPTYEKFNVIVLNSQVSLFLDYILILSDTASARGTSKKH